MNGLIVGDRMPEWSTTVEGSRMKVFSLITQDPNPIHWDVAEVAALGLGDRCVNQGGLNLAYVLDALDEWLVGRARVKTVRTRFLGNVFEGDVVVVRAVVENARGIDVDVTFELVTSSDQIALRGSATLRVLEEEKP